MKDSNVTRLRSTDVDEVMAVANDAYERGDLVAVLFIAVNNNGHVWTNWTVLDHAATMVGILKMAGHEMMHNTEIGKEKGKEKET
jgi:hypothetical protein